MPTAWAYRQPWGEYVTTRWRGRRLCSLTPPGSSARARGWGTTSGHTARSQLCRGPALWAWIALLLEEGVSSLLGCSFPGPRERLLMLGHSQGHAVSSSPTSQMRAPRLPGATGWEGRSGVRSKPHPQVSSKERLSHAGGGGGWGGSPLGPGLGVTPPMRAGGWLWRVALGELRARPAPWFLGCPSPHPARQARGHCTRRAHLLCLTSSD